MSSTCLTSNTNIIPTANFLLTSCKSYLQVFCINCEETIKNANNKHGCIWQCAKCRKQHSTTSISTQFYQIENIRLVEIKNTANRVD